MIARSGAYVVEPERHSDLWLLRVRDRPELRTEVHDLRVAAAMVRDLIATFDDVLPDSFGLTVATPKRQKPSVAGATSGLSTEAALKLYVGVGRRLFPGRPGQAGR